MNKAISWRPGVAPVSVIMISLNESHNMEAVLENLSGWAHEVFLVDSFSQDDTVDIALRYGVHVVQRKFSGFGDQWNFALRELPIAAPWTMKLDPDERLSDELKHALHEAMMANQAVGFSFLRRLWFMGQPLGVSHSLVRVWQTGKGRFTDVTVNEHPIIDGSVLPVGGELRHHDSPDLEHWFDKQNRYTTLEALIAYTNAPLAAPHRLLGTDFQRRMWFKKHFHQIPCRYLLIFCYHWLWEGAWRSGWVGYAWAHLRVEVMRMREYKWREMEITGRLPVKKYHGPGQPDRRVSQFE